MLKVRKTSERAEFEYNKLCTFPERPDGLRKIEGGYEYNFIEGHSPTSWEPIREAALRLWNDSTGWLPIDRKQYIAYVSEGAEGLLSDRQLAGFNEGLHYLKQAQLTPVAHCHGDMTFANCINGIFIDPGKCWGMPCQELDEAKILQSLYGWDVVRYGAPQPQIVPRFREKRVHRILLATHIVRLLNHDHPVKALTWAWRILDDLLSLTV